jgi:copper chaperone CopZ
VNSTYAVVGMHCPSCVMNIEEALLDVPGVTDAAASLKRADVRIQHDDGVTDQQLRAAIAEAGYAAT